MPEYYGYQPRSNNSLDFAGLGSDLASAFKTVEDKRNARRAANDQMKADAEKLINNYELGTNKTVNDLVLDGASTGRDQLVKWNKQLKTGEITPRDYRAKVNGLKENWDILAYSAKNLDERLLEALERQNPGEDGTPPPASAFEMYMTQDFSKNRDVSNKVIHIDDDGRVYLAAVGPDGVMDPNDIQDVKAMGNLENLVDNRVDVNTLVKDGVSNWGDVKTWKDLGYGATITETDARNNPAFKSAKYDLVESIVDENNPRSVVSVLLDNSDKGYVLFKSAAERNQIINERLKKAEAMKGSALTEAEFNSAVNDVDSKLIKVERSANGNYNPVITDQMIKDAKDIVGNQIEIQLGFEKEGTPKYKPPVSRSGGGDDEGSGDENNKLIAGYKASLRAFGFDPESVKNNPDDSKSWTRIENDFGGLRGGLMYVKTPEGKIQILSADGKKVLFLANNPKQLAQYIYGGNDVAGAQQKWEKARGMWLGNVNNAQPSQPSVPTATMAEWKANGWSDAQIKEAVKQGKIKLK